MLDLFWLTLVTNRTEREKGGTHPVRLGIGSVDPVRDCRDQKANLSILGSALGLQRL